MFLRSLDKRKFLLADDFMEAIDFDACVTSSRERCSAKQSRTSCNLSRACF